MIRRKKSHFKGYGDALIASLPLKIRHQWISDRIGPWAEDKAGVAHRTREDNYWDTP